MIDIHAQGYVGGLSAGAQTVMASFNSWHGIKNHGNPYLLTDVLKDRMGFDGFVVGDWNGHGQVKAVPMNLAPNQLMPDWTCSWCQQVHGSLYMIIR